MNEPRQKLARATGRNDFEYEFYVVQRMTSMPLHREESVCQCWSHHCTKSEAELAGLLAHELSHAVLFHGFH